MATVPDPPAPWKKVLDDSASKCADKGWDRDRMQNFLATCVYYQHTGTQQTANTVAEIKEAAVLATAPDAGSNWRVCRDPATGGIRYRHKVSHAIVCTVAEAEKHDAEAEKHDALGTAPDPGDGWMTTWDAEHHAVNFYHEATKTTVRTIDEVRSHTGLTNVPDPGRLI